MSVWPGQIVEKDTQPSPDTPGERLKRARLEAGYATAQSFAEAHQTSLSTYRSHEGGARNFTVDGAKEYAQALGVSWNWLMFGHMQAEEPAAAYDVGVRLIPTYDLAASAGHGALGDDGAPKEMTPFRLDWLASLTHSGSDHLALLKVSGDSMEPTLAHGDQILVDLSVTRPNADGVYVVNFDDAFMVKRLAIDPFRKRISVQSDNDNYASFSDIDPELVTVVGRVIWLGRKM